MRPLSQWSPSASMAQPSPVVKTPLNIEKYTSLKRLPSTSPHWPRSMPGHGAVMTRCPSSPTPAGVPSSLSTWVCTPKKGLEAEPGASTLKPGSASKPFFGVQTQVLKDDGTPAGVGEDGHLVITAPWPGMLRGQWGDVDGKRFKEVYFSMFKGVFTTGDGCAIDADGDHWLKGRIDDVLNVSGHRISTSDVEGALVSHPKVAEAAVVGYPHEIKGIGIYAYVTLNSGVEPSDDLKKELVVHVHKVIGPIATPDKMQFSSGLPKTRSGKIMRRILRKIAEGELDSLGDTSTLADPAVVEELKDNRQ